MPDHEVCTGTPAPETIKRQKYRLILDYTALATDLRAQIHGLELVQPVAAQTPNLRQYAPLRFLPEKKSQLLTGSCWHLTL